MDTNTKLLKKNAFRVTKHRGLTASRVRVPGGRMDAKYLDTIRRIAQTYGDGTVHITLRQGFEIPGIPFDKMPEVNEALQPLIEGLGINQPAPGSGYAASGTRNISACIGNQVCPFACYDTTALARRIEQAIFPNDLHFKIALTGCPNDCAKVRQHDFGIIGMTEPQFAPEAASAAVPASKPARKSPAARSPATTIGRSGKKNPRLGEDFIKWADADSIVKIITNTYDYVKTYIDPNAPEGKEHIGYIVDRTGFEEYKRWALKDVHLPAIAEINDTIYWKGVHY